MRNYSNQEIANILHEMAAFYEIEGVPFKPPAYERAALAIEGLTEEVSEIFAKGGAKALTEISGIGKGIAEHIEHLFTKGSFAEYDRLKKKTPVNIGELLRVEGVGPKTVKTLWQELKIKDLASLEKAARAGKIASLPHFGKKSEEKILKGIEFLKQNGGRFVLGFVENDVLRFLEKVRKLPGITRAEVVGSYRRMKETIGDIDILALSKSPKKSMEAFVKLPEVAYVYGKGETKSNVRLSWGIDADLRIVPEKSWGAALNYFTGSKDHNIALRERALKRHMKLSEYGLFKAADSRGPKRGLARTKEVFIAGRTEGELYKKLGLDYIEPELREMTGEIEAAQQNTLPKLVGYGDLKGDLQVQTNWTDGEHSIEEMAEAAKKARLEYICITDHTKSLAMTGGHDEKGLLKQADYIARQNSKFKNQSSNFRILAGAEVNIKKDGTLDIDDETLAKLDVVGAAVHSHFDLPREEQTKRVVRAMENPNVDIIFHLTGRRINRRKAIDIDIDEVVKAAKRTRTVLEIDAFPDRLDIRDEVIRKCVKAGVLMSIDSDAHSVDHFKYLKFGIAQARRGWATANDVTNTKPVKEMLALLKGGKR